MKDFQQQFTDYPSFLQTVSEGLWEGRGLDEPLARFLHPQVIFRDACGVGIGPAAVGSDVLSTLAAFPDLTMRAEDVLWCGAAQVGMLGAQRALAMGTHRGPGLFGAPGGAQTSYRVMTDFYAKSNRISDIWQVRDTGAILAQLGLDPRGWAEAQLARAESDSQPFREEVDMQGPYTGTGNRNQWGMAFADLLERVMQGGFSAIPDQYDRACQLDYPGGQSSHGPEAADAFWLGLRAALPSARFEIHHRIGMEEPLLPPRCAIRWSLTGRHDGWGRFGAPSGALVHVMGMSHAEFGPRGLRREWTLFDEAAILMQIAMHRG